MKRLLSALLTLALVLSLIPAVFAAEAATPEKKEYSFDVVDARTKLISDTSSATYTKARPVENGNKTYYLHKDYAADTYCSEGWRLLDASDEIISAAVKDQTKMRLNVNSDSTISHLQFYLIASTDPALKFALALQAPEISGFYYPQVTYTASNASSTSTDNIYISRLSSGGDIDDYTADENLVERDTASSSGASASKVAVYTKSTDEIVVAIENNTHIGYKVKNIVMNPVISPDMEISIENVNLDLTDAQGEVTTTASVSVTGKKEDGTTNITRSVSNNFITYHSDNEAVKIDATGKITAVGGGEAKIWAETTDYDEATETGYKSNEITVTVTAPSEEPEEPGEAVTDTKVSVAVQSENTDEGTVSWSGATIDEVNMGDKVSATATAKDGYVFRYWKNAIGQVLSDKAEESFVINTNSAITAVFDKVEEDAATVSVELFNANGMPFDNKTVNKDTTFAEAIAGVETPSYTGFGAFKHWSMYADESKIDDNMLIKENTRAVAIFNAPTDEYTVKVNGTAKYSDVLYGTEVTVSSIASDFSCWKLGEKIVSYDKDYSFTVWGNVDLTEVKGETVEKAPVAVLTTVGSNPLLIYSVPTDYTIVEAGILFGSTADITISSVDGGRAAAARGTGQFTAQPKADTTPAYSRGYLIFKNNTTGVIRILYAN